MKKITFVMLIITFIMYMGLNYFPDKGVADTSYNSEGLRDSYLNIMVCNKSQYDMVKKIVGERHNIQYLFDKEEDMIEFKYNKENVENVSNMDLFIYTGKGYEPWANSFINDLDKSKVGIVNVSRGIRNINYINDSNTENPYYWLSSEYYKLALYNIKNAIQDKDPKNRDIYEENYNKAVEYIDSTLSIYRNKDKKFEDYTLISISEKENYFLNQLGIQYSILNSDEIDQYVLDKNINPQNVIIISDVSLEYSSDKYKVITLESYNGNKSFEQLIYDNYKQLYNNTATSTPSGIN